MNSYSKAIAVELQKLQSQGADIPDEVIVRAANGEWDLGAKARDLYAEQFDTQALSGLSAAASREEFPDYWEKVDAAGGYSKTDPAQNLRVLAALLSSTTKN